MYQCGPDGLVKDITPIQKIEYMKLITLPPTRTNVVRESMIELHNVSADCGSKYTIITSNLAIAKVAKQIQCKEQLLSILFLVMFGRFHMEQNVSSAIRKIQKGKGDHILSEKGAIATGSLHQFLIEKVYYWCHQIHTLLSSVFHDLHIQYIVEKFEIIRC